MLKTFEALLSHNIAGVTGIRDTNLSLIEVATTDCLTGGILLPVLTCLPYCLSSTLQSQVGLGDLPSVSHFTSGSTKQASIKRDRHQTIDFRQALDRTASILCDNRLTTILG